MTKREDPVARVVAGFPHASADLGLYQLVSLARLPITKPLTSGIAFATGAQSIVIATGNRPMIAARTL